MSVFFDHSRVWHVLKRHTGDWDELLHLDLLSRRFSVGDFVDLCLTNVQFKHLGVMRVENFLLRWIELHREAMSSFVVLHVCGSNQTGNVFRVSRTDDPGRVQTSITWVEVETFDMN